MEVLEHLLEAPTERVFVAKAVSRRVNSPLNDDPSVLVHEPPREQTLWAAAGNVLGLAHD